MTRYIVVVAVQENRTFEVFAGNAAEAKELATSGEIDPEEDQCSVVKQSIISCQEVKSEE